MKTIESKLCSDGAHLITGADAATVAGRLVDLAKLETRMRARERKGVATLTVVPVSVPGLAALIGATLDAETNEVRLCVTLKLFAGETPAERQAFLDTSLEDVRRCCSTQVISLN